MRTGPQVVAGSECVGGVKADADTRLVSDPVQYRLELAEITTQLMAAARGVLKEQSDLVFHAGQGLVDAARDALKPLACVLCGTNMHDQK